MYSYWDDNYVPEGWSKNINAPAGVHVMNKNESTALRKLKKQTGLTEEELRKEKKYRKVLSEAQKEKGKKNYFDRLVINIVKKVTKETKLPVQHPEFKEKLNEELNRRKHWYSRGSSLLYSTSPDKIIYHYLSLRKDNKGKDKKKK
mgnify:CR=1 FL=1